MIQKIPVGILGATGMVGQKFVELLAHHPWFEITALAASERSIGKPYKETLVGPLSIHLPPSLATMPVVACKANLPCQIVFSGLDGSIAGPIEKEFADAGYLVVSNASAHRMDPTVPLLIPEINPHHLELLKKQSFSHGAIITNPNCSVIGIAMALKPLIDKWGVSEVHAVTLQAISGAGYPGVASLDILDNVIPYIVNEEKKIETEPLKIFDDPNLKISAQCHRVPVTEGHLASLSLRLKRSAHAEEVIAAWQQFSGEPQHLQLPTAPKHPLIYLDHPFYPQPKLHRFLEKGMCVSIGRLQKCPLLDWKFVLLSHNTVRGAAGCAILNAELMIKKHLYASKTLATAFAPAL